MNVITGSIVVSGRLAADPILSETQKGKPMAKMLLETELVREINHGEFRAEAHLLPIVLFSWVAEEARALRNGSSVTIATHLSGTKFTPTTGEVRYGIQLAADALFFPRPERNDAMQNGSAPTFDDARELFNSIGKHPVFLPINAREKGPEWKGWPKKTYEETLEADYQRLLRTKPNTGVLLGAPSEGLCAIDFDCDAALNAFLEINPVYQTTLRTRGNAGAQVWGYITGERPHKVWALKVHKDSPLAAGARKGPDKQGMVQVGEFRAEGVQCVIRGIHPSGWKYTWVVAAPPITIAFSQIHWPNDIAITWEEERKEQPKTDEARKASENDNELLKRAIVALTVDKLWAHFGFPERKTNPVASPFRDDNTPNHPSFSVYDQGRRFRDHNAAYGHHRGDSFDFYQLAADQDAHAAFEGFVELAGLGAELLKNQEDHGPFAGVEEETSKEKPRAEGGWQQYTEGKKREAREKAQREATAADPANWGEKKEIPGKFVQTICYPEDSILADLVEYERTQVEGADSYIIGSGIAVSAAIHARKIWFPWRAEDLRDDLGTHLYPNVYIIAAGKPGDRKSSTSELSFKLIQPIIGSQRFLPKSFSPETLFDEYDEEAGGCPDKVFYVNEANPILVDWMRTQNGERIATRILDLYDCVSLTESFRRNKDKKEDKGSRREISETSTTLYFNATFNVACFQGQSVAIRAGLDRRVLYHVADGHGRFIERPAFSSLMPLIDSFRRLLHYSGPIDFSPEATELWNKFQRENRQRIDQVPFARESELSRLSTEPTHVTKLAMIYAASRAAKKSLPLTSIDFESLQHAIIHVAGCLEAAAYLDQLSQRAVIEQRTESIIARISIEFADKKKGNTILLSRTELTHKFAANPERRGSLTPDDLYLRIVPYLISQDMARLYRKDGRLEVYAFLAGEEG